MELDISYLATVSQDKSTAERYAKASKARQTAMEAILWNEEMGQWLDYWIDANSSSQVCTLVFVYTIISDTESFTQSHFRYIDA